MHILLIGSERPNVRTTAHLFATIVFLLVLSPAIAFEADVPTNTIEAIGSPSHTDEYCEYMGVSECFFVAFFTPNIGDLDGVMYSIPFNIGINQGDAYGTILLLRVEETSSLPVENSVCGMEVTYSYDSEAVSVVRKLYDESGECSKLLTYSLLDRLTPSLNSSADEVYAYHLRLDLYVTDDFLWFEVSDRTNPIFTPVYSSPTFFGQGEFAEDDDTTQVDVYATSVYSADEGSGMALRFGGERTGFKMATFSYGDLQSYLSEYYSERVTVPLTEYPKSSAGVIASSLF